jgi:hypothetical protein
MLTVADIRFSKDPTPYKTYFSAAWSRTGRKGPYAHYYIHIQPNGDSFVGKFSIPLASFITCVVYLVESTLVQRSRYSTRVFVLHQCGGYDMSAAGHDS